MCDNRVKFTLTMQFVSWYSMEKLRENNNLLKISDFFDLLLRLRNTAIKGKYRNTRQYNGSLHRCIFFFRWTTYKIQHASFFESLKGSRVHEFLKMHLTRLLIKYHNNMQHDLTKNAGKKNLREIYAESLLNC